MRRSGSSVIDNDRVGRGGDLNNRGISRGGRGIGNNGDRYISDRYYSAYDRLDGSPSRLSWLRGNNYPSRAFGVGHGSNRGYYKGRGFSHRGYHGYGNRGFRRSYFGGWGCYNNGWFGYGSRFSIGIGFGFGGDCYRPYYYGGFCRPYTTGYYTPYVGFYDYWPVGGYNYGYWPSDSYVENNYYYDNDDSYASDGYVDSSASTGSTSVPTVPGVNSAPARVHELYRERGERFFLEGRFDDARQTFVLAMLDAPDDAELLILYAYSQFATGEYRLAASTLDRALRLDPTLIDSPVDVLRLYGNADEFGVHVDRLDSYLSRLSNDYDSQVLAGYVRYAAGAPDAAIPFFSTVAGARSNAIVAVLLRDAAIRAQRLMEQEGASGKTSGVQTSDYGLPGGIYEDNNGADARWASDDQGRYANMEPMYPITE